jgi:two-component system response regulator HydG
VERAVVLAKGRYLTRDDFAFLFRSPVQEMPLTLKDNEKQHIERILNLHGWNVSRSAATLAISRVTLHHKIKMYGLIPSVVKNDSMRLQPA